MALERTVERREYELAPLKRASWGAIFGGAFIAVAVMTLLGALGVAIGATTIDPATGDTPGVKALGIGAGIWWLVSGILALLAGGAAAGRLAGLRRKWEGTLHGLVVWALATVAIVALMTTVVGAMISGAFRVVGTGASVAAQGVRAVGSGIAKLDMPGLAEGANAPDVQWEQVKQEAMELLRQTKAPELQPEAVQQRLDAVPGQLEQAAAAATPEAAKAELESALSQLYRTARTTVSAADKDAAVNVLVARTELTEAQARQRVDAWAQTFGSAWSDVEKRASGAWQDTQAMAVDAAEATANAVASAAWWMFFYLLITAVAAGVGGLLGAPKTRSPRVAEAHRRSVDPV